MLTLNRQVSSTMLGFVSADASALVGQHPRFDLTKNRLITNIRYFENEALVVCFSAWTW